MYKLKLITRYLLKRRITHFAVLAVSLCVFIVVVVMMVMNGLVWEFKQKNHDFFGDCIVGTKSLVGFVYYEEFMDVLEDADFVVAVSPVVKNYALLRPENIETARTVEIMGFDPARQNRVTNFGQTLHYHDDDPNDAFRPTYDPNALGCVFGIDLALWKNPDGQYTFDLRPARLSYALTCFPLNARGAPARSVSTVATQRFHYSDVSYSGIARVDGNVVYIPLDQAQALCMDGARKRVSALFIKFRNDANLQRDCGRVRQMWDRFKASKAGEPDDFLLETVSVESWKEYRRASIAPMEQEELIMSIMFVFVGMTTVFIVFVVFYMIVNHKTRDIGILKSVGVSDSSIMSLFSGFALAVGVLGSVVGTVAGLGFLAHINQIEAWLFETFKWQLWSRTVYAIGAIPHQTNPVLLAVIVGCAISACLIGALVPSYLAARLRPVETLHGSRT